MTRVVKKILRIIIIIVVSFAALFGGVLGTYVIVNRQEVIEPFEIGDRDSQNKILLASQGSKFKEKLVTEFVLALKNDSTYISVIDCTQLTDEFLENWNAIIMIHTMQIHKIPEEAEIFLHKVPDLSKVLLVSTSGAGDEHYKKLDIDAVSSASRMAAINPILKWALPKLEQVLHKQTRAFSGVDEEMLSNR